MIALKQPTSDEKLDIYSCSAVALCPVCGPVLGKDYPLWGAHLHAALALHAAHRAVSALTEIPALTPEDRIFGRHVAIVAEATA